MHESILDSIKLALGIMVDYPYFDEQLITYTNAALAVLVQTGVGEPGFTIDGREALWEQFLGEKMAALEYSKAYVIMRVRLMFDPPQNSSALQALKDMIAEYEWRGYVECDPIEESSTL